jgi:hypothetical protein
LVLAFRILFLGCLILVYLLAPFAFLLLFSLLHIQAPCNPSHARLVFHVRWVRLLQVCVRVVLIALFSRTAKLLYARKDRIILIQDKPRQLHACRAHLGTHVVKVSEYLYVYVYVCVRVYFHLRVQRCVDDMCSSALRVRQGRPLRQYVRWDFTAMEAM